MKPESIAEALKIYKSSLLTQGSHCKAEEIFGQTITALVRFTLPGLGLPPVSGRKPTKVEAMAATQFMNSLPIQGLTELAAVQATVFEERKTAAASQYTYRSRLNAFLKWAQEQDWYPTSVKQPPRNRAPLQDYGHGSTGNKRTTTRQAQAPFSLKPAQRSPRLQAEIAEITRFYTAEHYPNRKVQPLKPLSIHSYIAALDAVLGWFHNFEGVPLEALSLDLLVPKVALKNVRDRAEALVAAEQAAEMIDDWLCRYLDFLITKRKRHSNSLSSAIVFVHAVVRFQYHRETDNAKYSNIPAMHVVQNRLRSLERRNAAPVAFEELKWLALPDVWQRIVTPLRQECAYRSAYGRLRSDATIALSFQLFLMWGCLTFRPPRRQQEFRALKIGLCCSIKRPEGLAEGQLIHPLPLERQQDKYCGYLYKDRDGVWYEDKTPESYKTGATYGHQTIAVANPTFPDGRCFYDYLEAFLYGYYRDPKGNWRSGGELAETPSSPGQWHSLRSAFQPSHNYVFVRPKNHQPHTTHSFFRMIQNSAHRLTGQLVTPHLLRDIYATWFLDQGYTEDRIRSLAYAMGHSVEVLRRIYDRRRPQQKIQPIQDIVLALLPEYVS